MKTSQILQSRKRLILISLSALMILLIPLIAMQFTAEVKWTISDFVVAAILLLITGLSLELMLRRVKTTKQRVMLSIILFLVFLFIWAELAVGLIGTPFAGS
ncbi:MAG: hypothetical protein N3D80_02975 [Ignavibacterium album]|jgi:nitrate reductase NapE component|uniref:hypothetical protein n=1 Tax=Ignavibacterium album TaxID=591197 RepID=UPI0026EAEB0E|nr:hypothetical protein [Ignavibacterium album]MCX8104820.1 hypothetical protein [Ignavibacterium album]